jgi:hypothetical protein
MQATEILKQHGATKVILFGSILDHTFKLDSDIEMPSAAWWEWYLKLGETLNFPIDFFRHSYSYDLDWDELKPKAENLRPIFEKFEAALQQFFVFLKATEQIE